MLKISKYHRVRNVRAKDSQSHPWNYYSREDTFLFTYTNFQQIGSFLS